MADLLNSAEWPQAYTANGELIRPGLKVRDYNWETTTVVSFDHWANGINNTQIPWWRTANGGQFDGSRLLAL